MSQSSEHPPGPLAPLSLRHRVSLLYEGRRQTILEVAVEAMRRAGLHPVVEPQYRYARGQIGQDITIEVSFATSFRIFGALIDTLWAGKNEGIRRPITPLGYRFGRPGRFVPRSKSEKARGWADALSSDPALRPLIARAELTEIRLEESPHGRIAQLRPLAGTITALYFPPLPPYTVRLRPGEADAQLELLTRLLTRP
ncbi:hypothetical protein [Pseudonocardia asaccharolytica]|uniref:Uncharacterized protein n=1 Tax=Pseudonocardia asaccharolytica DSM 44247 = NBRC 16224 TaxID=1123024 RepID=A0A511CY72_9PSEU|nr:hypothetical protein [Pseudonocardia asaccharolytica]GEL17407.1 hypothetical protein PA7_12440 [Pseudonocardia asaccharolytica DSM 44247 = NBRC 16224]